jgi:uncharacterized protein (DUF58 family)
VTGTRDSGSMTSTPPTELHGPYADLATLIRLRHLRLRRHRVKPLIRSSQSGMRLSKLRGRGIDFSEVRAYQPGDDARNIDWRVTARKAKPHTKIYREERERPTLLVVDQTQRMFFGTRRRFKSVAAAEAAALLGWHALSAGDRVGGVVFDNDGEHVFKPYRNSRTLVRFLNRLSLSNRALSRNGTMPARDCVASALERVRRLSPNGARIYLLSDFGGFDAHHEALLVSLSRHNTVVAMPVHDPMEHELPAPGSYVVRDGRGRIDLDAGDVAVRRRYRRRFEAAHEALADACQRVGIQVLPIATNVPIGDEIGARLLS